MPRVRQDFGEAEFIFTEKANKNLLKARSRLDDDEHRNRFYLFRLKDHHGLSVRYKCFQCDKLIDRKFVVLHYNFELMTLSFQKDWEMVSEWFQ